MNHAGSCWKRSSRLLLIIPVLPNVKYKNSGYRQVFITKITRGCPLSIEDGDCNGCYPGATQEGVAE
jgi:hypothetical protein